jgi:ParB-like chromosome segregation protein Spo0J
VRVPIQRLLVNGSPRLSRPDQDHISMLAQVLEDLPPIVVHRRTMTVIDGVHRLEAFRLQGAKDVRIRFFDGSDQEAFVEAVRLNRAHGKPLTLQERQQAAVRVLRIHPEWSDRAIARLCGLSPKTVGARRQRQAGEFAQLKYRVGLDGKTRRVDASIDRRRQRRNGTSPQVARLPEPDPSASSGSGTSAGKGAQLRQQVVAEASSGWWHGDTSSTSRPKQLLMKDAAWQSTDAGRAFARWFDAHHVVGDDWVSCVDQLPLSRLIEVGEAARGSAATWQHLADAVEARLHRARP